MLYSVIIEFYSGDIINNREQLFVCEEQANKIEEFFSSDANIWVTITEVRESNSDDIMSFLQRYK